MTSTPATTGNGTLPLIDNHRRELTTLCRRFHVRRLDLFGSAAGADFMPERSDLDFLVEFDPAATGHFNDFFDLREALESLFLRPVDLVMTGAVENPYVESSIEGSRRTVYAA